MVYIGQEAAKHLSHLMIAFRFFTSLGSKLLGCDLDLLRIGGVDQAAAECARGNLVAHDLDLLINRMIILFEIFNSSYLIE